MISDILKELDKVAQRALVECAQPHGDNIEYEAGRRIGVAQGIARARQAIIDQQSRDDSKDNDL